MIKKVFLCFIVFSYILFLTTPVFAQEEGPYTEPDPPPASETEGTEPGRLPDANKAIESDSSKLYNNTGPGTARNKCKVPVRLNKDKIVNNIDFDVPFAPRWLEQAL